MDALSNILGDNMSPEHLTYVSYAVMAIITIITIFFLRSQMFGKKTSRKKHILFVGPEKTGKTVLTNLLAHGTKPHHDTVTSMTPTRRTGNNLELTDFPGSAQARDASLDQQLASAAGVVFVIDGRFSTMTEEARSTAQLMKRVLVNAAFRERQIPLLVAFNKIDLISNGPKITDEISSSVWLQEQRSLLERELDGIKDEMLTSTGDNNTASHQLGTEEKFVFQDDVDSPVDFCCNTCEEETNGIRMVSLFCHNSLQK